jgi:hypothetical protein
MSRALHKHKYIQEMVRIYNREHLAEKCSLTLSLSLGNVDTFFVPSRLGECVANVLLMWC